jgi:uncharacterized membrane protein
MPSWGLVFRLRQSLKGSLWALPLAGGILGVALSHGAVVLERDGITFSGWDYSRDTALTILTTIVGASVGLTGFVVTVSVLVVQMATGTFSARYMRLWYRDRVLKATLAVLIGTLSFSFALLRHIDEAVPSIGVTVAGLMLGSGIVLFLVFLDRFVHRLRPVMVASLVARSGRESLRATAALASTRRRSGTQAELDAILTAEPALVITSQSSGVVQAIDDTGLLSWATRHEAVLILPHGIGDFVSTGASLAEIHAERTLPKLAERQVSGRFALGIERTIEQDPGFALRILVDVAIRALSPAVNDPTTAVQVLNHLESTLTLIGSTPGLDGRWEFRDDHGALRMVMPSQRWEDYLTLGVTEIRQYGAVSIQVARRLQSMLDALGGSVLPEYVHAVDLERERLVAGVAAHFGGSADADRAPIGDRQGIGGPPGLRG